MLKSKKGVYAICIEWEQKNGYYTTRNFFVLTDSAKRAASTAEKAFRKTHPGVKFRRPRSRSYQVFKASELIDA